jgi:hypothetical protein
VTNSKLSVIIVIVKRFINISVIVALLLVLFKPLSTTVNVHDESSVQNRVSFVTTVAHISYANLSEYVFNFSPTTSDKGVRFRFSHSFFLLNNAKFNSLNYSHSVALCSIFYLIQNIKHLISFPYHDFW